MTTIQPTEIVGRAFAIYKQQAGALIPAALVVFAVVALSELVFDEGLLVLIASAIGIVAHTFYTGMVVRLVDDVRDGVLDASVSSLFASVAPVALTLILASLLVGIGVGIGFILLIIPGLFLMTIWAVVAPVVVLEQRGVIEALGRSQELVKGNGWGVFGVIVIVFLLTIGAGIVGGALAFAGGDVVRVLVTWAVTVLVAPLAALATSVLYFALRDQP
ncbi:hypothetical protein [Conexibacter woesei]|uniref:Glycerophosphoryl diester phosphodiesterase membrane domain-containing protein n=1 Tax=Conexibacter woesei (strain DSM 14684 / CCUG 47730 / CIP 108061 / JCM 11494 / NBRC 100937 / ID131577) TaxID=469383 RepID=D3EZ55_CONWI|nr:hypothetical protein [Conexibacter woesei]ADB51820.1 hypothetical protein Cwoe_3402 [Conexibacter woesei DSM 14684]